MIGGLTENRLLIEICYSGRIEMSNNTRAVGKVYAHQVGKRILDALPPERRALFEESMEKFYNAGLKPNNTSTRYVLDLARNGRVVDDDWVQNAVRQVYDRTASLRAYRDTQARNATELARLQGLHGIDFLQRPFVQSTLGSVGAAYNAIRNNPIEAGVMGTALALSPFAGYGTGYLTDRFPDEEERARARAQAQAYLDSSPALKQYGEEMSNYDSDLDFDQTYGINRSR